MPVEFEGGTRSVGWTERSIGWRGKVRQESQARVERPVMAPFYALFACSSVLFFFGSAAIAIQSCGLPMHAQG